MKKILIMSIMLLLMSVCVQATINSVEIKEVDDQQVRKRFLDEGGVVLPFFVRVDSTRETYNCTLYGLTGVYYHNLSGDYDWKTTGEFNKSEFYLGQEAQLNGYINYTGYNDVEVVCHDANSTDKIYGQTYDTEDFEVTYLFEYSADDLEGGFWDGFVGGLAFLASIIGIAILGVMLIVGKGVYEGWFKW